MRGFVSYLVLTESRGKVSKNFKNFLQIDWRFTETPYKSIFEAASNQEIKPRTPGIRFVHNEGSAWAEPALANDRLDGACQATCTAVNSTKGFFFTNLFRDRALPPGRFPFGARLPENADPNEASEIPDGWVPPGRRRRDRRMPARAI